MMNRYRVILLVPWEAEVTWFEWVDGLPVKSEYGKHVFWTESHIGDFKTPMRAARRARRIAWNHTARVPPYWSAGCRIVDRKTGRRLGEFVE
jgi:hypothetical protein